MKQLVTWRLPLVSQHLSKASIPTRIQTPHSISKVAVSKHHAVIALDGGELLAWGGAALGGDLDLESKPKKITGIRDAEIGVRQIALGDWHTAVLATDGSIWTCGDNRKGQLGHRSNDKDAVFAEPQKINSLHGLNIKIIRCSGFSTIALSSCGLLFSWGFSSGNGHPGSEISVPRLIQSVPRANNVWCGRDFSLARLIDGNFVWWGRLVGLAQSPQQLVLPVPESQVMHVACTDNAVVVADAFRVYTLFSSSVDYVSRSFDDIASIRSNSFSFLSPRMFWVEAKGLPEDDPISSLRAGPKHIVAVTSSGAMYMCSAVQTLDLSRVSDLKKISLNFSRCHELIGMRCLDVSIGSHVCVAVGVEDKDKQDC